MSDGKHKLTATRKVKTQGLTTNGVSTTETVTTIEESFLSIYNARRRRSELEFDDFKVEIINKDGLPDEEDSKKEVA